MTKEEALGQHFEVLELLLFSSFQNPVEKKKTPSIYFLRAKASKQLKLACPSLDAKNVLSFQQKPFFFFFFFA